MRKHPGFKAVQNKIAAKQGVSKKAAGAILAAASRGASAAAKKKNPRLKRVSGPKKAPIVGRPSADTRQK